MALSNTRLSVRATATQTSALDLLTATAALDYGAAITLTNGVGAGQANLMWSDTRTLAASTGEDIDLAGSLVDAFGASVTFARIKGLIIKAASGNTNNLVVGNAASNGFVSWVGGAAHTVTVRPGGLLALFAPDATAYAVTAGTADLLHVLNSGAGSTVSYDVVLIGAGT